MLFKARERLPSPPRPGEASSSGEGGEHVTGSSRRHKTSEHRGREYAQGPRRKESTPRAEPGVSDLPGRGPDPGDASSGGGGEKGPGSSRRHKTREHRGHEHDSGPRRKKSKPRDDPEASDLPESGVDADDASSGGEGDQKGAGSSRRHKTREHRGREHHPIARRKKSKRRDGSRKDKTRGHGGREHHPIARRKKSKLRDDSEALERAARSPDLSDASSGGEGGGKGPGSSRKDKTRGHRGGEHDSSPRRKRSKPCDDSEASDLPGSGREPCEARGAGMVQEGPAPCDDRGVDMRAIPPLSPPIVSPPDERGVDMRTNPPLSPPIVSPPEVSLSGNVEVNQEGPPKLLHVCGKRSPRSIDYLAVWFHHSSRSHRIVTASRGSNSMEVFDAATGEGLLILDSPLGVVPWCLIAFEVPGQRVGRIASGHNTGHLTMWSGERGDPVCVIEAHEGGVRCLVTYLDHIGSSLRLVSGGQAGDVKVWSHTGSLLCLLDAFASPVRALTVFSSKARPGVRLVAADGLQPWVGWGQKREVRVFNPTTGDTQRTLHVDDFPINETEELACFEVSSKSKEGQLHIVSAGFRPQVIEAESGRVVMSLRGHRGASGAVAVYKEHVAGRDRLATDGPDTIIR
jgi:hypothetical protein